MDGDLCRDAARAALNEAERDRIAESLRLAERLGGEAVTIPAADVADGDRRVRAGEQHHAYRHRAIAPLALAGAAARLA